MQRYNKIVNQANKTKKDILDDTMFMICMTANWRALQSEGQVPLIDRMPNFMLRNHFFDAPIEHAADGQEYH
jgi:hypothetical protein